MSGGERGRKRGFPHFPQLLALQDFCSFLLLLLGTPAPVVWVWVWLLKLFFFWDTDSIASCDLHVLAQVGCYLLQSSVQDWHLYWSDATYILYHTWKLSTIAESLQNLVYVWLLRNHSWWYFSPFYLSDSLHLQLLFDFLFLNILKTYSLLSVSTITPLAQFTSLLTWATNIASHQIYKYLHILYTPA